MVEGLRERGLAERSLVSTMYPSLERLGELAPGLRRGWSVPRVRRSTCAPRWRYPPTRSCASCARACQAGRGQISSGGCEAIMAHQVLVSRRLVKAVHSAGGELYVWTVDDAARIKALEALVITNDPRLFSR